MKIIAATTNKGKIREFQEILGELGYQVVSMHDEGIDVEVEETGTTFSENALIKARAIALLCDYPVIADDSGLCVDYLDGAPGVYSARYSGEHGNDEMNNKKLLKELDGVPQEKRTAYYVAAIACVFPDGRQFTVRGECHGKIAFEESGNCGFGYDPLFISEKGCFGHLSAEEKDSISHRGKALRLFKEELLKYIKEQ